MTGTSVRRWWSYREYAELEDQSPIKHEFLDGEVWAMSGGTPEHAAIAANVIGQLWRGLQGKPCRVFSSDLRVRVRPTGLSTYPDISVVCGKPEHRALRPRREARALPADRVAARGAAGLARRALPDGVAARAARLDRARL